MRERLPGRSCGLVVALLALGSAGWWGCDARPTRRARTSLVQRPRPPSDARRVSLLAGSGARIAATGTGLVEPWGREVRVSTRATGRIVAIPVAEGDSVSEGATLVVLEQRLERAALAVTEAEVSLAEAELSRALHGARREELQAAGAEAEAARVRQSLSQRLLRQSEALGESGYVATTEVERARAQAEADRLGALGAEARRLALARGTRREDLAAAQARVAAAVARREQARAVLEQLTIRSPLEGTVLRIGCRVGEFHLSESEEPLVILGDTRRLRVRAELDERDLGRVRPGSEALVYAEAFPERAFPARVVQRGQLVLPRGELEGRAEHASVRTLEVVLDLTRWDGLLPGQRVNVVFEEPARPSGPTR